MKTTTKQVLKSIVTNTSVWDNEGPVEAVYIVAQTEGETTVEQEMTLTNDGRGWQASILLDDFPLQETAGEAAKKLSNWLRRLAQAVEDGEYDTVDQNNL